MDAWPRYRALTVPHKLDGTPANKLFPGFFGRFEPDFLKACIDEGQVLDDQDRPVTWDQALVGGQLLRVFIAGIAPSEPPPPLPKRLYEDDQLFVFSKPAGLLAHPAGQMFAWSMISVARLHYPDEDLDLVHRLDRRTSGIILVSRRIECNRYMKRQLSKKRVQKTYLALVKGRVPWEEQQLDAPIGREGGEIRIKMAVRSDGQAASTHFQVIDYAGDKTLLRVTPKTGRTHQIRVHLAHLGFPIAGDPLYGVPNEVFLRSLQGPLSAADLALTGAPRQALHAAGWSSPYFGEKMGLPETLEVDAGLPPDMQSWIADPSLLES